jgi:lariat debranching enzyme
MWEYEVRKLLQVKGKLDIFLSHDWPRGVANCGHCDRFNLFKLKPFFKDEIMRDELGSPAAAQLCNRLRPSYWFSAHFHVKFPALIHHSKSVSEHTVTARRGEVEGVGQQGDYTKFLALDKCLPRREYLQILDFPDTESPKEFQYDVEWLAILKKLHAEMPMDRRQVSCQTDASSCQGVSQDEMAWVSQKLDGISNHIIPTNFQPVAPAQGPYRAGGCMREAHYVNPQTIDTLTLLDLPYLLDFRHLQQQPPNSHHQNTFNGMTQSAPQHQQQQDENPEEIDIDIDIGDDVGNPEEIEI